MEGIEILNNVLQQADTRDPAFRQSEKYKALVAQVDYLLSHDFEKLVFYLYRIDVDENKLRQLLQARQGENAAGLIADLLIERQLQKIETRKQFGGGQSSDEEKW
ncbi:MAG: hypothetical protein U0U70_15100 [Chitinophagaceae bacterium]